MTKDEALKLALEHFETWSHEDSIFAGEFDKEITAIKESLAQPEQEPVAWMVWGENNVPSLTFTKPSDKYVFDSLYMTPPQRTWVGLTDEEIQYCVELKNPEAIAEEVEAKLKGKNT